MKHDAIIVGGGVFGCTIARLMAEQGRSVLLIDSGEEGAATPASASLMKEGWLGLPAQEGRAAMSLLDRLYGGLETVELMQHRRGKGKPFQVTARRLPGHKVLPPESVSRDERKVISVSKGEVVMSDGTPFHADTIVVAAGHRTGDLLPVPGLVGKIGVAFWVENQPKAGNTIREWAPYKQLVAFSVGGGLSWTGDGTSILQKNWKDGRLKEVAGRCSGLYSERGWRRRRAVVGVRPFGFSVVEHADGLWSATGGGKAGTVLSAVAAAKICGVKL